jgi:predicted transcriptional regulator
MLNKRKLLAKMVVNGESQNTLAEKLGCSRTSMSRYLNQKGTFDLLQVERICEILGIKDNNEKCEIFLDVPF